MKEPAKCGLFYFPVAPLPPGAIRPDSQADTRIVSRAVCLLPLRNSLSVKLRVSKGLRIANPIKMVWQRDCHR
jgi:hypothetical protein